MNRSLRLTALASLVAMIALTGCEPLAIPVKIPEIAIVNNAPTEEPQDPTIKSLDESASAMSSGWLHTDSGLIRDSQDQVYTIKSISWFGMETDKCAPHGLWEISLGSGLDHIVNMGFNTVRLPYSNQCLAESSTESIDYSKNSGLTNKTPQQVMDIFIEKAESKGLKVILDRHRPDSASQSSLWYTAEYSEAKWIADWKMLAERYKTNSTVIGFDLHNEPAGKACWGCGDPQLDWQAAATRAGNAVLDVNPELLIIVEGVESYDNDFTWWGSNLQGVASKPVILNIKNRVVYSPHEYPASVYEQKWFKDSAYPGNLSSVWDKNWGYIQKKGIAPVLIGEFGTKLETRSDKLWLTEFVKYIETTGISHSYWSFNPNSGDTGGIVKDNWATVQEEKLAFLKPLLR
jgi:endoglucanase